MSMKQRNYNLLQRNILLLTFFLLLVVFISSCAPGKTLVGKAGGVAEPPDYQSLVTAYGGSALWLFNDNLNDVIGGKNLIKKGTRDFNFISGHDQNAVTLSSAALSSQEPDLSTFFNPSADFAFAFWVKNPVSLELRTDKDWRNSNYPYKILVNPGNNYQVEFYVLEKNNKFSSFKTKDIITDFTVWYFVVVQKKTDGYIQIYVNGGETLLKDNANVVVIGDLAYDNSNRDLYLTNSGNVDNFAYFQRALTTDEILALYEARVPVCGDSYTDSDIGEQCDDGNMDDGDGCSASCQAEKADADSDGVADVDDNCPSVSNSDQLDTNSDGIGDLCEESQTAKGCNSDADCNDDDPSTVDSCDPLSGCLYVSQADQGDIVGEGAGEVDPCLDVSCVAGTLCVAGVCLSQLGSSCESISCVADVGCSALNNICGGLGAVCNENVDCANGQQCVGGECGLPLDVLEQEAETATQNIESSQAIKDKVRWIAELKQLLDKYFAKPWSQT